MHRVVVIALVAVQIACTGIIGDSGNDAAANDVVITHSIPVIDDSCVPTSTATRAIALTPAQIANTLVALFGGASLTLDTAAAELGRAGCTPQNTPQLAPADGCIVGYIETRGAQLFHRPLTDVEVSAFYSDYLSGFRNPRTASAAVSGLYLTLVAMLQSPQFLSRTETTPLTSYEMAAAIAYTITDGPPDAALLTHAQRNDFSADVVRAEVTRLIASDAGHATITEFVMEWLGVAGLTATTDTPITQAIADAMLTETRLTIADVLFNGSGTIGDLLTVPYTFVNEPLANFYGYSGPTGSTFQKVSLADQRRPGILAHGSFLASTALPPITLMHRGNVARAALFCEGLPPFDTLGLPDDFEPPKLKPNTKQTERQQIEEQDGDSVKTPSCYGCHQFFVPIGAALTGFDDYGRARSVDNGSPVDTSGAIIDGKYLDPASGQILAPFDGLTETDFVDYPGLTAALAGNARVQACAARAVYMFASGRGDIAQNDCALRAFQTHAAGESVVAAIIDYMTALVSGPRAAPGG